MDLFFDLDGTLIDSADAILVSFAAALGQHGLVPAVPLDRSLIGPPLRQTLKRLTGSDDPDLMDRLTQAFKDHYDGEGCLGTPAYPGVPESLHGWASEGHRLFIVTNKRLVPTLAILQNLALAPLFSGIHTLDETTPPAASKGDLVAGILARHGHPLRAGLLVGDSADDGRAAQANGIPFIFAEYGYGSLAGQDVPVAATIRTLAELGSHLGVFRRSPQLL